MAHGQISHIEFLGDETARARRFLGGTVAEDKQEIPCQRWFAVVSDSEGTEVGLFEELPAE